MRGRSAILRLSILLGLIVSTSHAPARCLDAADRERLKTLTLKALDDAFEAQIENLFEVWMRDLAGQPQRAQQGVGRAIKAWRAARDTAERYQPPECPPEKGSPK